MKMSALKKGTLVVVSSSPKTQIYKVKGTDGRFMDISTIKKPTKKQLQNAA